MNFLFKSEVIDYDYINNKQNETILFLHGWGGNKNSFITTINLLKRKYNILTLTMPTVLDTNEVWCLNDYVELIFNLLSLHNIASVIIMCHSFGFRVACLLKEKIEIKKMVVTGGAGLKKINNLKKIVLNNNKILLKQKRFNYLYDSIASEDYKNLSAVNKKTFNNIVSVNTKNFCSFHCPMLLFWGKFDTSTKVWMAKYLKMKNKAKLILTNTDHFAYLKDSSLFNNSVVEFLK